MTSKYQDNNFSGAKPLDVKDYFIKKNFTKHLSSKIIFKEFTPLRRIKLPNKKLEK